MAELTTGYNAFAIHLFKVATEARREKNVFISPLSVAFTLAMLENGANEATLSEIKTALGAKDWVETVRNERNKRLLDQLASGNSGVRLEIANSLWANKDIAVQPAFIGETRESFHAEVSNLDFTDEAAAADHINGLVNEQTHGKISNVVDGLKPEDVLVAVNAVYFKGSWMEKFRKSLTKDKSFKPPVGPKFLHPRMSQDGSYSYLETREFQLAALPYRGGGVTAYVLLPKARLAKFLPELTPPHWKEWLEKMAERSGTVELPRFTMECQYDLKPWLEGLGLHQAFAGSDSFPRIGAHCTVSKAAQATYVDVNEEGTEAAAATSLTATIGLVDINDLPKPFEMIVDRPFLFVIQENSTEAILFMGVIYDPRG
ncbi:MAG TPA: serpin family protein [Verrucomicrobiae bacterium]|nr:serpin family protein [Verrucomicrobiae bacterium]